jgi:hypothetical protein
MKDFSKEVYGLFPTSYSPINQCARGYTCHCVIIYHFYDAKDDSRASHAWERFVLWSFSLRKGSR